MVLYVAPPFPPNAASPTGVLPFETSVSFSLRLLASMVGVAVGSGGLRKFLDLGTGSLADQHLQHLRRWTYGRNSDGHEG